MTAGSGAPGTSPGPGGGAAAGIGTGGYGGSVGPTAYGQVAPSNPYGQTSQSKGKSRGSSNPYGISVTGEGPMGFSVQGPSSAMGQAVSASAGDGGMGFVVGPIAQANAQAQATAVANAAPLGIVRSTDGIPVLTKDGNFVTHRNLSNQGNVPITQSHIDQANFYNSLVDNPLGKFLASDTPPLPTLASFMGKIVAQALAAQTPGLVANTTAALATYGPQGLSPTGFGPSGGTGNPLTGRPLFSGQQNTAQKQAVQNAIQTIASTPPAAQDPVTGVTPLAEPVQGSVINVLLQNALANLQPTRPTNTLSNREFDPQVQNIVQQFATQALA